jgi:hypothetical protein
MTPLVRSVGTGSVSEDCYAETLDGPGRYLAADLPVPDTSTSPPPGSVPRIGGRAWVRSSITC